MQQVLAEQHITKMVQELELDEFRDARRKLADTLRSSKLALRQVTWGIKSLEVFGKLMTVREDVETVSTATPYLRHKPQYSTYESLIGIS
jgi:hypothetical protein